ncbi:SMI1/KNR4 family protein [Dactylosporangium darangshiense]|uniref:Knr4/Smi1-like domain-containing protein n=1 Tax=Dactylosporangium darangshiense TaxID=579108 RepID=A0ABP8DVE2_9ACTN
MTNADAAAIAELESRLGCTLPPSYRGFLANAEDVLLNDEYRLLPAHEVGWLRDLAPGIVDDWELTMEGIVDPVGVRDNYEVFPSTWFARYLRGTLLISEDQGEGVYLLNPGVIDENGEWEAWFVAHWVPGADRARSFGEMLARSLLDPQEPAA